MSSVPEINNQNTDRVCKFYLKNSCTRDNCKFLHSKENYEQGSSYNKQYNKQYKKKNTVCFTPMTRPVDLRIVYDLNYEQLQTKLTDRDLLLVPNLFSDFRKFELYDKLVQEIKDCEEQSPELLKLWHGNDKIAGTHFIADDKLGWKKHSNTFNSILNRISDYFNIHIKATRFNWYVDTDQWKPFHFDAAAFDEEKRNSQNMTISLSFGCTRSIALEFAEFNKNKNQTTISLPVSDGEIYAFTNTTNDIWRHGILQEKEFKNEGRISIIVWGWMDGINKLE
jgi:hypothetical protein